MWLFEGLNEIYSKNGKGYRDFQLLIIFAKSSILHIWLGFEYATGLDCKT